MFVLGVFKSCKLVIQKSYYTRLSNTKHYSIACKFNVLAVNPERTSFWSNRNVIVSKKTITFILHQEHNPLMKADPSNRASKTSPENSKKEPSTSLLNLLPSKKVKSRGQKPVFCQMRSLV
jgi:hypothetical protein